MSDSLARSATGLDFSDFLCTAVRIRHEEDATVNYAQIRHGKIFFCVPTKGMLKMKPYPVARVRLQ